MEISFKKCIIEEFSCTWRRQESEKLFLSAKNPSTKLLSPKFETTMQLKRNPRTTLKEEAFLVKNESNQLLSISFKIRNHLM